jgi:hypothetical protein
MTKLNQIVAVVKGAKEDANKRTAPLFHSTAQTQLFAGITQTYRPLDDDGVRLPDDNTEVQLTVGEILEQFRKPMTRMLDTIATAEYANTEAFGDIVVDGETLLEKVPVTFLMQLEKQLEREVRGLIVKLPTLDPAESWVPSASQRLGVYETPVFETHRTKKVQRAIVLYPATEQHPAQTQMVSEDVIDGYWAKKKFSGAITAADKDYLLEKCDKLIAAVKFAREQANDRTVVDQKVGSALFGYLFD